MSISLNQDDGNKATSTSAEQYRLSGHRVNDELSSVQFKVFRASRREANCCKLRSTYHHDIWHREPDPAPLVASWAHTALQYPLQSQELLYLTTILPMLVRHCQALGIIPVFFAVSSLIGHQIGTGEARPCCRALEFPIGRVALSDDSLVLVATAFDKTGFVTPKRSHR